MSDLFRENKSCIISASVNDRLPKTKFIPCQIFLTDSEIKHFKFTSFVMKQNYIVMNGPLCLNTCYVKNPHETSAYSVVLL